MQARRVSAAASARNAAESDSAAHPAAVSETHLDDDAVLNLERLLPSDFAVHVYFICGQRCCQRCGAVHAAHVTRRRYGLGLEETDEARSMGRCEVLAVRRAACDAHRRAETLFTSAAAA